MSEEQRVAATQLERENPEEESKAHSWEDSQSNSQLDYEDTNDDSQVEQSISSTFASDSQQYDSSDIPLDYQSLDLKFVLDIPLQVTVELGRKRVLIQDLLKLNQGSVIELNKQINEPLDILVNQKLIARGEVVVVNDKFGVRITDIISPQERLQQIH